MKLSLFGFAIGALFVSGCARVNTQTTLKEDGSYSRKIEFKVSKSASTMGGGMQIGGSQDPSAKPKDKPEDYFRIPTGPEFKIARTNNETDTVVTVTREAAAGSPAVQDVALWAEKGKVLATSSVVVNKLPDGNLEYLEMLHATQAPKEAPFELQELRPKVKKALPAALQTTEIIDKVTKEIAINFAHALFGPPEPTLLDLFSNPDGAIRKINIAAYHANVRSLRDAGLAEDQAKETTKALALSLSDDIMNQSHKMDPQQQASPESKSNDNDMTPMSFSLKFPGDIVESNGLLDPVTGEVYWSLLPASLEAGDVRLRVVVHPR